VVVPALRHDPVLEQVHWSTTRHGAWPDLRVFAFDHRAQLEEMPGATPGRLGAFKQLCLDAALEVAQGRPGHGILCDARLGRQALWRAAGQGLWIGRPAEAPGTRPLQLESELGPDCGGLGEWPLAHVVKCLCVCHPDDDAAMWAAQGAVLTRLFHAARRNRLEFLLEVIPSKVGPVDAAKLPALIGRIYGMGIFPDWWKLEPLPDAAAWEAACAAIRAHDPHVRGILVLGLDAPLAALEADLALAARQDLVKGFAVGRTIFAEAARGWLAGRLGDAEAVADMAARYARLCAVWDRARAAAREESR
jgi:5-dehydro-2-deoxygluconokinase